MQVIRVLVIVLVPGVVLSAARGGDEPVPVKILARCQVSGKISPTFDDPPSEAVMRSEAEVKQKTGRSNLKSLFAVLGVDSVDFQKQMLVQVTAGTSTSSGHRLEITRAEIKDGAMTVWSRIISPRDAVGNAVVHPGQIVLVERFDGKVVFAREPE